MKFPYFWEELETELNISDIENVKVIFTALGYSTRESVSQNKTKAKLASLEHELLQMLSNKTVSENIQRKFPQIKSLLPFTSGMKSVILQVVRHINNKGRHDDVSIRDESVRLFVNAKKVIVLTKFITLRLINNQQNNVRMINLLLFY